MTDEPINSTALEDAEESSSSRQTLWKKIASGAVNLTKGHLTRGMLKYADYPLLITVIAICIFGVIAIFSATSSEVTVKPATVMEMLSTQSTYYARMQLLWILIGLAAMAFITFFDYRVYREYANLLYIFNILLLLVVLGMESGRGGMTAFFSWGDNHTFQPSEFGKVIIIICLAKVFSDRTRPIRTFKEVIPLLFYVGIPMGLIIMQPDVGTCMVYLAIFCVLILVSGTNWRLIVVVFFVAILVLIPLWYSLNNTDGENFRLTRILIWLWPDQYPDEARQVINGQIAMGSGGLLGKGIVSPGSFASLGYISDDHTDFIFSIVGESFGLIGAALLVLAYIFLFLRLFYNIYKIRDPYGSFILAGVIGMFIFHVLENLCMVIGLFPVTGIPLPFVSYGGTNMLTNMMAIGLAENVIIRNRIQEINRKVSSSRQRKL